MFSLLFCISFIQSDDLDKKKQKIKHIIELFQKKIILLEKQEKNVLLRERVLRVEKLVTNKSLVYISEKLFDQLAKKLGTGADLTKEELLEFIDEVIEILLDIPNKAIKADMDVLDSLYLKLSGVIKEQQHICKRINEVNSPLHKYTSLISRIEDIYRAIAIFRDKNAKSTRQKIVELIDSVKSLSTLEKLCAELIDRVKKAQSDELRKLTNLSVQLNTILNEQMVLEDASVLCNKMEGLSEVTRRVEDLIRKQEWLIKLLKEEMAKEYPDYSEAGKIQDEVKAELWHVGHKLYFLSGITHKEKTSARMPLEKAFVTSYRIELTMQDSDISKKFQGEILTQLKETSKNLSKIYKNHADIFSSEADKIVSKQNKISKTIKDTIDQIAVTELKTIRANDAVKGAKSDLEVVKKYLELFTENFGKKLFKNSLDYYQRTLVNLKNAANSIDKAVAAIAGDNKSVFLDFGRKLDSAKPNFEDLKDLLAFSSLVDPEVSVVFTSLQENLKQLVNSVISSGQKLENLNVGSALESLYKTITVTSRIKIDLDNIKILVKQHKFDVKALGDEFNRLTEVNKQFGKEGSNDILTLLGNEKGTLHYMQQSIRAQDEEQSIKLLDKTLECIKTMINLLQDQKNRSASQISKDFQVDLNKIVSSENDNKRELEEIRDKVTVLAINVKTENVIKAIDSMTLSCKKCSEGDLLPFEKGAQDALYFMYKFKKDIDDSKYGTMLLIFEQIEKKLKGILVKQKEVIKSTSKLNDEIKNAGKKNQDHVAVANSISHEQLQLSESIMVLSEKLVSENAEMFEFIFKIIAGDIKYSAELLKKIEVDDRLVWFQREIAGDLKLLIDVFDRVCSLHKSPMYSPVDKYEKGTPKDNRFFPRVVELELFKQLQRNLLRKTEALAKNIKSTELTQLEKAMIARLKDEQEEIVKIMKKYADSFKKE